jgi:predicted PhzF superfamily epimerase YddE/YHI9
VALGLEPAQVLAAQQLYNGSPWMGMLLDDPDTLLALEPDWPRLAATGQKRDWRHATRRKTPAP